MPIAMAGLLLTVAGFGQPATAASLNDLLTSNTGRSALLERFSGGGGGSLSRQDETRFRANRRHPDVGYIALDSICLSCVIPQIPAPDLPPAPVLVPAPVLSSPPAAPVVVDPSPPPPLAPPPPIPESLPEPSALESAPIAIVHVIPLEERQASTPLMTLMQIEAPIPTPSQETPPPISQAPAPLSILGVTTALGMSRALRNRIRAVRQMTTES